MATDRDANDRLLAILERLLEIPATDLEICLSAACDALASALHADKVDAFLYDESRSSLVAVGTSTQPLSALRRPQSSYRLPSTRSRSTPRPKSWSPRTFGVYASASTTWWRTPSSTRPRARR
jgi:hypothetical protein